MWFHRTFGRGRIAVLGAVASGAIIVAAGGVATTQASTTFTAPAWTLQIGQPGAAFVYPWGMAWDPVSDTILTSDYNNWQVRRFTTDGTLAGTYSSKAALGGQQPYGIAVDAATDDFVVDDLEGYLRYSATGTLLDSVSTAPEHAYYAPFLAISPTTETVYVVQSNGLDLSGSNVVLMYDENDHFLGEFGSNGKSCSGAHFGLIRGVDVDNAGNVYINDVSNHCVQVFNGTGTFERSFSTKAGLPINDQLSNNTRGLAIDRANGIVYIADSANQFVGVFSTAGKDLGTIGTPGSDCSGAGQLDGPRDIAVGSDGTVYVSDYTCFTIDAFNPLFATTNPGGFLQPIPNPTVPPPPGGLNFAVGVGVSQDGTSVFVTDTFNQRVQEFDGPGSATPGAFVQMWGSRQPVLNDPCAMDYPRGAAVDPVNGNLWINDTRSGYIKAYTPTGNAGGPLPCATPTGATVSTLAVFGGQVQVHGCIACAPGKFFYSRGIFVGGPNDDVYVPDSANGRLQVLTQAGVEVPGFPVACGTTVANPAGYNGCSGVTVDSAGNIYAVSINQGRVDVFSPSGKLLRTIGATAPGGRLGLPFDAALSPSGNVLYVSEINNNRVSEFDPATGAFLGSWGSLGTAHGQFNEPMGLAVDAAGNVYVNDYGNDRIEVFTP
jgi:DNA-binding beta-propeller fold protein YncE